jgi:type II secretory pathway pseudopilin PulG
MRNRSPRPGFSMLEMLAVLAMIITVGAVTMFRIHWVEQAAARAHAIQKATVLVQEATEKFRQERGELPRSINELLTGKYFSEIPELPDADGAFDIDPQTGTVSYSAGS